MAASEFFQTWITVIDRAMRAHPAPAPEAQQLQALHDQMVNFIAHNQGRPKAIESQLLAFAADHADVLVDAAAQLMTEIFELIDPEIARYREAKNNNLLNEKDKAALRGYISTLEQCDRLLGGMKKDKPSKARTT